jgi:3-methyl-2-oxobutanoate hydroxymethyltransferase
MRRSGTPITMLTAYDFPTARALDSHGVDIALVGDSLAQVCLGLPSTTRLTLDEMLHHTRAVARGAVHPLIVADMPFGSYHASSDDAVRSAVRMVQDGHVEAVKLEGGPEIASSVRRISQVGVPVMAHVGLMPQRHTALSGYRVQGRDAAGARAVLDGALALQEAGAFSVVLEAIPHRLAEYITARLRIPTIGIGAGPGTSGQVLVWDDVMSRWQGKKPKFVRRFVDVGSEERRGVESYVGAVRDGSFPNAEVEGYEMDGSEWETFLEQMGDSGWRATADRLRER